MFKPGEMLCHARQGVGIVLEVQQLTINDKKVSYYLLEMATGDKLLIPVGQTGDSGLSKVTTPEAIIETLSAPPQALPVDFRQRADEIERKVSSGDSLLIAEALRDLTWKMKSSKLSSSDARLIDKARKLLTNMLVVKPHMDLKAAARRLDKMLEQAVVEWGATK